MKTTIQGVEGLIYSLVLVIVGILIGLAAPRHQHHWVEVSKNYLPGVHEIEAKWVSPREIEGLYFGKTFIRYRCTEDGEEKVKEFVGEIK